MASVGGVVMPAWQNQGYRNGIGMGERTEFIPDAGFGGDGKKTEEQGKVDQQPRKISMASIVTNSSLPGSNDSLADAGSDGEEDSVRVVVRIRPPNDLENNRKDKVITQCPGKGALWVDNSTSGGRPKQFTFDGVFGAETSQYQMFESCGIKKLLDMALDGYACTAFAFGQTGSGKTHTITGPMTMTRTPRAVPTNSGAEGTAFGFEDDTGQDAELQGLIQRAFLYLFDSIGQRKRRDPSTVYTLRATYLEIYNEQVKDLLNPADRPNLPVRWSKEQGFYVENLFCPEFENIDDIMAVLEEGMHNRHVGSHNLNEHSSRSHTMLTLNLDCEMADPDDASTYVTKHGKICFVDLAGSEKVKESKSAGDALVETTNINKSLLTLGNCISALSDPKKRSGHIPFRDSKLTKLLSDSLGGTGVTLMVACISPSAYNASETMNTLRYAVRAKRIKNKPLVRMDPREKLILSLQRELKRLRSENEYLRTKLNFPQSRMGMVNGHRKEPPPEEETVKQSLVRHDTNDSDSLYEMLQEYMVENENLRHENTELFTSKDHIQREQVLLSRENDKLVQKLENLERVLAASPLSWQTSSRHSSGHSIRRDLVNRHSAHSEGPPVTMLSPLTKSPFDPREAKNRHMTTWPPSPELQPRMAWRSTPPSEHSKDVSLPPVDQKKGVPTNFRQQQVRPNASFPPSKIPTKNQGFSKLPQKGAEVTPKVMEKKKEKKASDSNLKKRFIKLEASGTTGSSQKGGYAERFQQKREAMGKKEEDSTGREPEVSPQKEQDIDIWPNREGQRDQPILRHDKAVENHTPPHNADKQGETNDASQRQRINDAQFYTTKDSDALQDMNAKLRAELADLEGEIARYKHVSKPAPGGKKR
ncbi:kinesin-like protein KIF12 isoform X2 [Branchiostoma floridae]|uniref:Kinesin-like protein n=1 Tax=Branchiostoma floridae TaxID=7739 RepID=A0A9J7LWA5_BRAFL|nr:kinesin-like protein KIF12 isoform X2 [Branchiostoma floridae]